mgnify:CR=1 FL=1
MVLASTRSCVHAIEVNREPLPDHPTGAVVGSPDHNQRKRVFFSAQSLTPACIQEVGPIAARRNTKLPATLRTATARVRAAWVQLVAQLYRAALAKGTLEIVQSSPALFSMTELDELIASAEDALPSRIAAAFSARGQPEATSGCARPDEPATRALARVHVSQSPNAVAVNASPSLVRIDEDGEPLQGGAPKASLIDYAEAMLVVSLAQREGLQGLPDWLDRLLDDDGVPTPALITNISAVASLAAAFAGDSPGAPGFLRRHLLEPACKSSLPLGRLLEPWHWRQLARAELSAFLLTPSDRLAPPERALQTAAVDALAKGADWHLRDAEQPWQRPDDPAWWGRLRSLAGRAPQLLPTPLLADLGRGLCLDVLPASAGAAVLTAEMHQGTLWRRRFQTEGVARAALMPGVLPILLKATEQELLDSGWTEHLQRIEGSPTDWNRLAETLLASLPDPARWGDLLRTLLSRLINAASELSSDLIDTALAAMAKLRLEPDLDLWIALLDLVGRIDPPRCRACLEQHLVPILAQLGSLTDPKAQRQVLDAIATGRGGCLRLADLADAEGLPQPAWLRREDFGQVVLGDGELRAKLAPEPLLRFIAGCARSDLVEHGYRAIDISLAREPKRTAAALIAADAWGRWRRNASPRPGTERNLALLWLAHPAHAHRRDATRFPQAPQSSPGLANVVDDADCLETWRLVVSDLGAGLDAAQVRWLTDPRRVWPWLPGLEQRQIKDLSAACLSTTALVCLAEALVRLGLPLTQPWANLIVNASRYPDQLSATGLRWLVMAEAADRLPILDLGESTMLCALAGERYEQAVVARIAAIGGLIEADPEGAIKAADSPNLWGDPRLRAAFRERLPRMLTKRQFPNWVSALDQRLRATPVRQAVPATPTGLASADNRRIAAALHHLKQTAVAELLFPGIESRLAEQPKPVASAWVFVEPQADLSVLTEQAKTALLNGEPTAPVWSDLATLSQAFDDNDREAAELGHPLVLLARRLSEDPPSEADRRRQALSCVERVLQSHPGLFAPFNIQGQKQLPMLAVLSLLFPSDLALMRWLLNTPTAAQWRGVPGWRLALIEMLRQTRDDDDSAKNQARESAIALIENYHAMAVRPTRGSDSTSEG